MVRQTLVSRQTTPNCASVGQSSKQRRRCQPPSASSTIAAAAKTVSSANGTADNLDTDRQPFRGSTGWNNGDGQVEDVEGLRITESAKRTQRALANRNFVRAMLVSRRGPDGRENQRRLFHPFDQRRAQTISFQPRVDVVVERRRRRVVSGRQSPANKLAALLFMAGVNIAQLDHRGPRKKLEPKIMAAFNSWRPSFFYDESCFAQSPRRSLNRLPGFFADGRNSVVGVTRDAPTTHEAAPAHQKFVRSIDGWFLTFRSRRERRTTDEGR